MLFSPKLPELGARGPSYEQACIELQSQLDKTKGGGGGGGKGGGKWRFLELPRSMVGS